jgi:gamma-glutamyltranspeptidase/glutathione hydrolase
MTTAEPVARDVVPDPTRPPVLATDGMVSSSHPAISALGYRVLADGGNAVDAALAMAGLGWLMLPGQCGIGGDAFALVREPDGRVWSVSGSGTGPDGGHAAFYADRGFSALPLDGALSVAVPGAVAALAALHAGGASRDLADLWEPAAAAAERGVPCTAKTRGDVRLHAAALAADGHAARALLPAGRVPDVGQRLVHSDLAATIRTLARDPRSFYSGELAERAVTTLLAGGAPFTGLEWERTWPVEREPAVSGRYQGRVVHATPLPTPGWMVLQQAAICDGWVAGLPWLDAEAVHVMAGAARTSFADRVTRCGSDSEAWRDTLAAEEIAAARERVAFDLVPTGFVGAVDGDTTSVVAVDRDGRAVSLIHSLAFTFGACLSIPGTGVLLNNRFGRGAYLEPGHPNEAKPGRKPLTTLNAWVVTDDSGALRHVGNTPGGDGQVQWNMQLLSHLLDHGLNPQAAVDAPRFTVYPGSDSDTLGQPEELRCESRLDAQTVERLRQRGHDVRVQAPWGAGGSALVVSVDDEHGCLLGGADSRQEGIALGV